MRDKEIGQRYSTGGSSTFVVVGRLSALLRVKNMVVLHGE
jgi:hypothetical protein